jgi:hypothetical protein
MAHKNPFLISGKVGKKFKTMMRKSERAVNNEMLVLRNARLYKIAKIANHPPAARWIDTGWFMKKIHESQYGSQRQLAPKIFGRQGKPLEPSALSLMLRGMRAMQLEEAEQLAELLGAPLQEVLFHAGVDVGPPEWQCPACAVSA